MLTNITRALRTSVRPLITMLFAVALVAGFFLGMIESESFLTLVAAAIAYWFGSRVPAK